MAPTRTPQLASASLTLVSSTSHPAVTLMNYADVYHSDSTDSFDSIRPNSFLMNSWRRVTALRRGHFLPYPVSTTVSRTQPDRPQRYDDRQHSAFSQAPFLS